ncbi:hypothetical protein Ndes2526B_g01870 [Nannochloris sp. 'desiccata']
MPDVESELNPNDANTQEDLPPVDPAAPANAAPATTSLPQQPGEWDAAYDHASQKWYYYNVRTRERRWEPPPDWISNDGEAVPPTALFSSSNLENKHGYYYRDMHGIDQGPFSVQQLCMWRGALPMDLPVWNVNEEENKEKTLNDNGVAAASPSATQFFTLAEVLGDAPLLAQWRVMHPEIVETTCAAPPATVFEIDQQKQQQQHEQHTTAASPKTDDDNKRIEYHTSLAEAVIAGLPPDDEAVQLSRVAASAGQSLHEVVEWSRKQNDDREEYTVAAVHTAGRGRIQAVGAGERESLYADMGSWIDPAKMEEQMKKASRTGGKRKMTAAEAARELKESNCSASSTAVASGEAQSAVSKASSEAFAQCKTCPCSAQSSTSAEAVSQAVAKAIASVTVSVRGTKGCETSASGSAQASATATVLAEAWAKSASDACGAKTESASKAISTAFASAAARADAAVSSVNGGNADATATAIAQEIKPAVAKATSDALAACKCAGPTKPASSSASSSSTATATTGGAATDSSKTELPSFNTDFPDFPDFPEMNFPNFDMPEFPEMGQFP